MSLLWIIRLSLLAIFYIYALVYMFLLRDREKHEKILENKGLNIFLVIIYNAVCYTAVLLPADLEVIVKPSLFEELFLLVWYAIFSLIINHNYKTTNTWNSSIWITSLCYHIISKNIIS